MSKVDKKEKADALAEQPKKEAPKKVIPRHSVLRKSQAEELGLPSK